MSAGVLAVVGHSRADVEKWTAQDFIAFAVGEIVGNHYRPDIAEKAREAHATVAELLALLIEARTTYIPSPTGLNARRLPKNVEFIARLDAALARAQGGES